jgi:hypothetical protein
LALFSRGVALVSADVLVYSLDYHEEPEKEFSDAAARFGEPLPVEGLRVSEQSLAEKGIVGLSVSILFYFTLLLAMPTHKCVCLCPWSKSVSAIGL